MTVSHGGREVSLGLLPYLPIHSPTEALAAAPDFFIVLSGISLYAMQEALKVASIRFSPPDLMTTRFFSGERIQMQGATRGRLHFDCIDASGTFHHDVDSDVCPLCSAVQVSTEQVSRR